MILGKAYLLFCRRIGYSFTAPIDESVKTPTHMVAHSENKSVSPAHDSQDDAEPIDIASEFESDFETKFEPEVRNQAGNQTGSQKPSTGSKVTRKRRSWESKPAEKAQALNDIRLACRICSKEHGSHNHSSKVGCAFSMVIWSVPYCTASPLDASI